MPDRGRVCLLIPAYNEEAKLGAALDRVPPGVVDRVLVIDDGSTDGTAVAAQKRGADVLSLGCVRGVGAALREGLRAARRDGFDIAVIMAGNNKDEPNEIPALLAPIRSGEADFVIGSRYLKGGGFGGDMPFYRKLATRFHPLLMSLAAGKRLTESTNGFRAFRLSLLNDRRIRLDQPWLDGYGLEVYLLFKAIKLGYRHAEVPCTKIYPPKRLGTTKMKPIIGWWDMLKPVCLLGSGLRT